MNDFPQTIETDELILEQMHRGMVDALLDFKPLRISTDPSENNLYRTPYPDRAQAALKIERYPQRPSNAMTHYFYKFKENYDGILGRISIIPREKHTELYWESDRFTPPRAGYATQAAQAVIQMLAQKGHKKVRALIDKENIRSVGLAKRLGMQRPAELNNPQNLNERWELDLTELTI